MGKSQPDPVFCGDQAFRQPIPHGKQTTGFKKLAISRKLVSITAALGMAAAKAVVCQPGRR
jgi:hypothetical protein